MGLSPEMIPLACGEDLDKGMDPGFFFLPFFNIAVFQHLLSGILDLMKRTYLGG